MGRLLSHLLDQEINSLSVNKMQIFQTGDMTHTLTYVFHKALPQVHEIYLIVAVYTETPTREFCPAEGM